MPKADLSGKRAVYPVEQRQRHRIPHIWMAAERKSADQESDKAAANDRDKLLQHRSAMVERGVHTGQALSHNDSIEINRF